MKKNTRTNAVRAKNENPLVGRYFHSVSCKKICWQGVVLGKIEDGFYLLQLFEWTMGEPSVQRIAEVSEMKDWLFYSSADEMKYSYECGTASKMKT